MFPLDFLNNFLPDWLQPVARYQPLPYLAYFPAVVFLGKVESGELTNRLTAQAGWVILFAIVC